MRNLSSAANCGHILTGPVLAAHRMAAIAAMAMVLVLFGAKIAPAAENEPIFIRTGSQQVVKVAFPVANMSADNANVVAASLPNDADKTQLLLSAKAAGTATLTLHGAAPDAAATLNIVVLNLLPDDVREFIRTIPGLEVKGVSTGVIIQGIVFNKKDKDQVDAVCAQRAHDVINLVEYNPVHPLLLKRIKEMIGIPSVEVMPSSDTVVLAGSVSNDDARKRSEDLAKSLADKVLNLIVVEPQQIELECVFISADQHWREDLGSDLLGNGIALGASIGSNVAAESSFLKNTSYAVTASGGAVIQCLEGTRGTRSSANPI